MPDIYAVCPKCPVIETVSDHTSHIAHYHDWCNFALILVKTYDDALKLSHRWSDGRDTSRQCCERDHDWDGNCDRHTSPKKR